MTIIIFAMVKNNDVLFNFNKLDNFRDYDLLLINPILSVLNYLSY